MKTIFIFCILNLIINNIQSQDVELFLINEIIVECDGTIVHSSIKDGDSTATITVELPKYYNYTLFRGKLNIFINRYSDLYVVTPWTKTDNDLYQILLIADNRLLRIGYSEEFKIIIFAYSLK